MKAISLWQPYASAIPCGLKRFETRHWTTKHRGPIAIHAAKRLTPDQRAFIRREQLAGRLPAELPFGMVVAVVNICAIFTTDFIRGAIDPVETIYGDYTPNRFAWSLCDIRPVKPFPFKGGQGMFNVPDELLIAA